MDDGSTDRTSEVARECGVHHIVRFTRNRGLAAAFMAGIDASIQLGADIIVNTDADNQYRGGDVEKLIGPILDATADYVLGERPISDIEHFSYTKKKLQKLGSWVIRVVSGTDIPDATTGFRAISRDAAMKLHIFSEYSYTLETIIQAGQKGMAISSVPVRTNEDLRPSRLVKSIPGYIRRSTLTIVRIFMAYKPFKFFAVPGAVSFALGLFLGLRFIFFYLTGSGVGHIQSVILSALLLGTGFFLMVVGLLADLLSVNRKLLEGLDWQVKKIAGKEKPEKDDGPGR